MIFQNEPAGSKSAFAFCIAVLALAPLSPAMAQGSLGGSIGKQDKVISGGDNAAPARPATRPASRPSPSRSRQRAQPSERASRRSLTGLWSWTGHCAKSAEPFVGLVTFNQSGNTFTAIHGGTNIWDQGTVSDTSINGNRVSFIRTYGSYSDFVQLTLSGNGNQMSGVIPNTVHSGRCVMNFLRR